jgi:hypothetical protein
MDYLKNDKTNEAAATTSNDFALTKNFNLYRKHLLCFKVLLPELTYNTKILNILNNKIPQDNMLKSIDL